MSCLIDDGLPDLDTIVCLQRLGRLAPHVPREVVQLIRQMMAKEPLRRPQTPRELIERLVTLEIGSFSQRA